MVNDDCHMILWWPLPIGFRRRVPVNTKSFIYIGIVVGLLIAWYFRANLKDIKDDLVLQIQKSAKLSPYIDDNVEAVVKQMDR
jgi:hypothetical protein